MFEALFIFLAYGVPHCDRTKKPIHKLPDHEFMDEVIKLGGTPTEVVQNDELCKLVTPILKNNYNYNNTLQNSMLNVTITLTVNKYIKYIDKNMTVYYKIN